jgi:hypothetical protein
MTQAAWTELTRELDRCAADGRRIALWLRDDDAVAVTAALDRLIELTVQWDVPVVVAVVPMPAEPHLAIRLAGFAHIKVAAHGFAHRNHALPGEKKQELGPHRPAETVLEELSIGLERLEALFPGQTVPMLVPPWNRIWSDLLPHLPRLGIRYLSTIGPEPPHEPVPDLLQVDCQLDIIDWRARGAHPHEVLADRLAGLVRDSAAAPAPIGILSHHLAHDEAAWQFLTHLFRLTARHKAVTWGWPVPDFYA